MLPAITVESLKEDKGYNKAAKKYIKEHDGLMKKLTKERTNIASNQCKAMEKLAKSKKWVCTQKVMCRVSENLNQTKVFFSKP